MTNQHIPNEKAATVAPVTALPALLEQNTCANNNSTPLAESQVLAQGQDVPNPAQNQDLAVIDVRKLFWSGAWQLFRDRAKAQRALEDAREQAQADIDAAEAVVVDAEAEREAIEPRLQADVERLEALALAGVLSEGDHAAMGLAVNEQARKDKTQAGRMLGLVKGRLTRTRKQAEAAVDAAESELAQIQERLDLLEAADPGLFKQIAAAWKSCELRLDADRAARKGNIGQAKTLLVKALDINPETEENARFYRRTREAIVKAEKRIEQEQQLALLKGRIQKSINVCSISALNAIETDARAAGVYDRISGELGEARKTVYKVAADRVKATKERAASVAQALESNGGKGRSVVAHLPGQVRVFTKNGKGFVLTETHMLKGGDKWVRREEPGAVVVSDIPTNGVVMRV